MEWPGLRFDSSEIGNDGLLEATNVSFWVDGELRMRPGLADRIDQSGALSVEWQDPYGVPYLILKTSAGLINTVKISDQTTTTVYSGLDTANRGCFARTNGRTYFSNDFDPMLRFSFATQTGVAAGIAAPTDTIGAPTASGGSCETGTVGLRYRYYDSKSQYISDPSGQLNYTIAPASALTFSIGTGSTNIIRSLDAKVDQIIIEKTDAGSSTFYRAAIVNQTMSATTIDMTDSTLRAQVPASRDGDFGHQQPPLFSLLTNHRGRLFGVGGLPYTITGVSVTSGSTTITVTGNTMSAYWAGRLVTLGTDTKTYRISSLASSGSATLSESYTGTTRTVTGAIVFSPTPDMLYWSRAGFPESWYPTSFARRVFQDTQDIPSGVISVSETLLIVGQKTMRMMNYDQDPAGASLITVLTEMGAWNQRCLVKCNGRVYGWGRNGAWMFNGMLPKHISGSIDDQIDGTESASTRNYSISLFERFFGEFDPRERTITWWYCTSADTHPQHGITYSVDDGKWSFRKWRNPMISATVVGGSTTAVSRLLLCDNNGYSWYQQRNVFDGVPTSMSSGGVVTITANPTGSTITVSESMPASTGSNLNGVVAVFSGQEKLVSSNAANTLTLASAFSGAIVGSEVYLGPIDMAARLKHQVIDDQAFKQRPSHAQLSCFPSASGGQYLVSCYKDFATSPTAFGAADDKPNGVSWTAGDTEAVVQMNGGSDNGGHAVIPLYFEWSRALSLRVRCIRPQGTPALTTLQLISYSKRSASKGQGDQ